MILLNIISSIIFIYIAFNVAYILLFAIAGTFRRPQNYSASSHKRKIAILIPSYKEDTIILETAINALAQDYPSNKYDVVIIADHLQPETLKTLAILPLKLIKVSFDTSTKAKSLKYALGQLPDDYYDIIMILDADNVMQNGCLDKTNHAFERGHQLIQLHRTAKNRNTPTAVLDSASEEINNHIFRLGHRALGLSSGLIGSGMALDYQSFKKLMLETDIENNPGEDREIYLELLRQGVICEYIENALVYDEKVASGPILENQRIRWISAQFQYAKRFWISEFPKTFSYNIHYLDYAIQTLLLPRLILLASTFLMTIIVVVGNITTGVQNSIFPGTISWVLLFTGCIISLSISIYKHITAREFGHALLALPRVTLHFLKALIKSRADQKEFIHTPKEFISK